MTLDEEFMAAMRGPMAEKDAEIATLKSRLAAVEAERDEAKRTREVEFDLRLAATSRAERAEAERDEAKALISEWRTAMQRQMDSGLCVWCETVMPAEQVRAHVKVCPKGPVVRAERAEAALARAREVVDAARRLDERIGEEHREWSPGVEAVVDALRAALNPPAT